MPTNKPKPKAVRRDRVESDRFRRYVTANARNLHGLPVAEAIRRSGCDIAGIIGQKILRALGVRPFRRASVLAKVNWRLPNATLCQVWNLAPTYVAAMRWSRGERKAEWDSRSRATYTDAGYLRALAAERRKAEAAAAEAAEVRARKNGAKRVKQWVPSRTRVP